MLDVSGFHVSLDSPDGTVFPSFNNSDFPEKDLATLTLDTIRKTCKVSPKYKFSADGKSTVSESSTLGYYISLTPENQDQLKKPQPTNLDDDPVPSTPNFEVKLILAKQISNKKPVDTEKLLQDVDALRSELEKSGGVDGRRLDKLSSSVADLAALQMSFAAIQGDDAPEPSDLTEEQWQVVLLNNQALNGWIQETSDEKSEEKTVHIRRSTNRAFEIRHPEQPEGEKHSGLAKEYYDSLPGIPLFFIRDDANVNVTEIQNAFQRQLATESFSSKSIRASAEFGTAASISASYDQEMSHSTDEIVNTQVDSLHVSYNFPRVVVLFEPQTLQLSEKCKSDAKSVDSDAKRDEFFATYGSAFMAQIGLGGRLTHTRTLSQVEKEDLDTVKTRTQTVAGASFSYPQISASAVYGQSDGQTDTTDTSSLNRSLAMSWEAHGGDTSLCSNPPVWASTVRQYKFWRTLDQSLAVNMQDFIMAVDPDAGYTLAHPTDTDRLSEERIKQVVVAISKSNGSLYDQIQDYYTNNFDCVSGDYDEFQKTVWKEIVKDPRPIKEGTKWADVDSPERVAFGCYMAYKGLIL